MNKAIRKGLAVLFTASVLISASSCGYTTATSETSVSLAPGETTAPTIDYSEYSFETMYGSQLINYLNHQYYFEGQPIPMAESNFYFIDAFLSLTRMATYGQFPLTAEGYIDLSAAVTTEIPDDGISEEGQTYATYGDYFVEYSERMLESTYIINSLAAAENITLSEETIATIDETINTTFTQNAQAGGISVDDYLKLFYGESCDVETMRTIMYNYKLADMYTAEYIENYEFADEDIMVPNVRYALFYAPEEPQENEVVDAELQESLANELYDNCYNDETESYDMELFAVYGTFSQTQYNNGEDGCRQYGEVPVERGTMVPAFEDWAYDESREEGDIEVIYAPEYGYFVVGYLGLTEIAQEEQEEMAVSALGEYVTGLITDGSYSFYTEQEYVAAAPVEPSPTDESGVPIDTSKQPEKTPINPKELIVTILAGIGGVAVIGLIIFGIGSLVKKGKKDAPAEDEPAKKVDPVDPFDEEDTDRFFEEDEGEKDQGDEE